MSTPTQPHPRPLTCPKCGLQSRGNVILTGLGGGMAIGSVFPIIGTIAGTVIGGIGGVVAACCQKGFDCIEESVVVHPGQLPRKKYRCQRCGHEFLFSPYYYR